MSLSNQKNALFGKGPMPAETSSTQKKSSSKPIAVSSGISAEMKQKKIVEAEQFKTKAMNALKTSVSLNIIIFLHFAIQMLLIAFSMES
jgi:hypothetical protein